MVNEAAMSVLKSDGVVDGLKDFMVAGSEILPYIPLRHNSMKY